MPADNIFTSCRKGDIGRITYLVEKKEVDLNVRDCWDSTPLYYACHCGHQKVVEYLLANGARCEANTFDGERCLYGALTNDIKRLLLDSKIVNPSNKRRDDFDEFCERMMRAEEFSDMTLSIGNKQYKLHRCIMSARSEYFSEKLQTTWKTREIRTNAISTKVFDEFINFIYTGRLTCTRDQCDEICRLSDKCKVLNLADNLKVAKFQSENYEMSKKRVKISTLIVDSPSTRNDLIADFGSLIDPGFPEEFVKNPFYRLKCFTGGMGWEWEEAGMDEPIYDLCFEVEGYRFYCNKVFICTRSEYFSALVQDHFDEYGTENGTPIISLRSVKSSVFTCVLYYIYTNYPIYPISAKEDIVLDVLVAADIYLLPGLKKHCANFLCDLVALDNVVDLLHIARMHDLPKLEDSCAEFIAQNVASVFESEQFRNFVLTDAREVKGRQETDSIPIIDDIRYHISSEVATFSDLDETQTKLKLIDNLLDDLGLEA